MLAQRPAGRGTGRAGRRRAPPVPRRRVRRRARHLHDPPLVGLAGRARRGAAGRRTGSVILTWDPGGPGPLLADRRVPARGADRRAVRRAERSPSSTTRSAASGSRPCRSRPTARTGSSPRTGPGPRRTSTRPCAPASRAARCSTRRSSRRASRGSPTTSSPAPGTRATRASATQAELDVGYRLGRSATDSLASRAPGCSRRRAAPGARRRGRCGR